MILKTIAFMKHLIYFIVDLVKKSNKRQYAGKIRNLEKS